MALVVVCGGAGKSLDSRLYQFKSEAMKLIVKDGQTLADIAVQEYGSWEAMIAIAWENGMCMTEVPDAGTVLAMPDATWNRTMQNWCKDNDVSPATARDQSNVRLSIFEDEFKDVFK